MGLDFGGVKALLADVSKTRADIFGRDASGDRQTGFYDDNPAPIPATLTPVREGRQLDELNFLKVHNTIVRIFKTDLASPVEGKSFRYTRARDGKLVVLRIDEIVGGHPLNPEHVLGCKAIV